MREIATMTAAILFLASTRLTWIGVLAIVALAAILYDAYRRVSGVLAQMDNNNDRLDGLLGELGGEVEKLQRSVAGGDPHTDEE